MTMTDNNPQHVGVAWELVDGDVVLPNERADWWGSCLSVLVAAIHHPRVLAEQQPDVDPKDVASWVLEDLPELRDAADLADRAERQRTIDDALGTTPVVVRHGEHRVRIAPGGEVRNLVGMCETFARAVLNPAGPEARDARGASGHTAAAWVRDLGTATGAIQ